jgi:hypothetical protein
MNKRFVAILAALVLILGGAALYVHQREDSAQPAVSAQLGRPLLKDLKASDIAGIVVRDANSTLTLVKKDKNWTIAERNNFPADLDKVTELVVNTIELKVGQAEPIGDADRGRLNIVDPNNAGSAGPGKAGQAGLATSLAFKAGDGRILAELLLGKKYFRNEPAGDPVKAIGDGRFVMLPTDPKQVFIVSEPFRTASTASADWIAKDGLAIERVKSMEYKPADGEGYMIERATDGSDWKLERVGGQRLDNAKANSAAYSLAKLEIEDVAASDKDTSLATPSILKVSTFDGMNYTLKIGQMDQDRYPVSVEIEGTPKREFEQRKDEKPENKAAREKSFAEEMKRLDERVAHDKTLHGHVLLVAKAKLADALKKKSELIEQKKVEPKK